MNIADFFVWSTIILGIWAALGPLFGVRYGQELAKKWQKQQWISENRKQECRELLNAMAADYHAKNLASGRGTPEDHARSTEAAVNLLNTFKSRIFIADEIARLKMYDRWSKSAGNVHVSIEERRKAFDELFAEVRGLVF